MKKICYITDQQLCNNPRLFKSATLLSLTYQQVTIVTLVSNSNDRKTDSDLLAGYNINILFYENINIKETSLVYRLWIKGKCFFLRKLMQYVKIEHPLQLGYSPEKAIKKAMEVDADLYVCHVDLAMYVGCQLIKKGKKVAFDFEDWYSKDYLVSHKPIKLILKMEQFALTHGEFITCPSESMASALLEYYSLHKRPSVLYNGFNISESHSTSDMISINNSIVWFSQTVGRGRGIEQLIAGINNVKVDCSLHLIGDCSEEYKKELRSQFRPAENTELIFHNKMAHAHLVKMLSSFEVGVAFEEIWPENKNVTISNKILQYAQFGMKIIASRTLGQLEVKNVINDVEIVDMNNSVEVGQKITNLLEQPKQRNNDMIEKYRRYFSWDVNSIKYLKLIDNALQ